MLVGINLLREGLDMPEVALVAILDADKEGFLRSETSLVQTIGRAARNVDGRVIMYADDITDSMRKRHRRNQPSPGDSAAIQSGARHYAPDGTHRRAGIDGGLPRLPEKRGAPEMDETERQMAIDRLEEQMLAAAGNLDFEKAAKLRDELLRPEGRKAHGLRRTIPSNSQETQSAESLMPQTTKINFMDKYDLIRGAREHNLKNVDLDTAPEQV